MIDQELALGRKTLLRLCKALKIEAPSTRVRVNYQEDNAASNVSVRYPGGAILVSRTHGSGRIVRLRTEYDRGEQEMTTLFPRVGARVDVVEQTRNGFHEHLGPLANLVAVAPEDTDRMATDLKVQAATIFEIAQTALGGRRAAHRRSLSL